MALSLLQRQGMDEVTAHFLWLVYMVPHLGEIAHRPLIVADYDRVMDDPRKQIERIARGLRIPMNESSKAGIEQFATEFLDLKLRHVFFKESDIETNPKISPLTRELYLWLRRMAEDRIASDSPEFWSTLESSRQALQGLVAGANERIA